jgi:hypothetical protein
LRRLFVGRVEQSWGLVTYGEEGEEEGCDKNPQESNEVKVLSVNSHIQSAFDLLNQSVKSKYLPTHCPLWSDAHHRTALLIVKYPELIDPEYFSHKQQQQMQQYFENNQ